MRISSRGHYGLRMMVEMAARHGEGLVRMSVLSEALHTPPGYLHSLLGLLKGAGLVHARAGMKGGYGLARLPGSIRVSDVLHVLEGVPAPVVCVHDRDQCPRSGYCATRSVWCDVADAVEKVLERSTLEDLVARERGRTDRAVPCDPGVATPPA